MCWFVMTRKLVLTKDIHQGDFLCRLAGELSDNRTDRPEEETFFLPKFVIVINETLIILITCLGTSCLSFVVTARQAVNVSACVTRYSVQRRSTEDPRQSVSCL